MLTEIHTVTFYSTAKLLDKVQKLKSHLNTITSKTKHHFRCHKDQVALKKMACENHQDNRSHGNHHKETQTKYKWRFLQSFAPLQPPRCLALQSSTAAAH